MEYIRSTIQTLSTLGVMISYHTIRIYHWISIKCQRYRHRFAKSHVYKTKRFEIYEPDHIRYTTWLPKDVSDDAIVVEEVTLHKGGAYDILKRSCIVHPNNPTDPFIPTKVPWWFIGCLTGSEEVCLTDEMAPFIVAGNVVTIKLLQRLTGIENETVVKWYYIHPATFEETEIPPEGITIHADITAARPDELPNTD